jgi:hypothetical protein
VIVLGAVVKPFGLNSSANLGSIFSSRDAQVLVGRARITQTPDGRALLVPMRTSGDRPLAVHVTVIGESGESSAVLEQTSKDVQVPLAASALPSARLRVEWFTDGRATHREITVALP